MSTDSYQSKGVTVRHSSYPAHSARVEKRGELFCFAQSCDRFGNRDDRKMGIDDEQVRAGMRSNTRKGSTPG